ncbi:hypothetical protein HYQ44_002858 [Verticillium longisporum]|nr:hypothetical protein HYQ44_002858 [Verticillium longisporum]
MAGKKPRLKLAYSLSNESRSHPSHSRYFNTIYDTQLPKPYHLRHPHTPHLPINSKAPRPLNRTPRKLAVSPSRNRHTTQDRQHDETK